MRFSIYRLLPNPHVVGHGINEEMPPFGLTVRSVLDFLAMGYEYDGKASDDIREDQTSKSANIITDPTRRRYGRTRNKKRLGLGEAKFVKKTLPLSPMQTPTSWC